MSGREVREYTNLSDPKGVRLLSRPPIHRVTLTPTFFPLSDFLIEFLSEVLGPVHVQIGSLGKGRIRSTMRTSPSSAWLQRLDRIVLQPLQRHYRLLCCAVYICMFILGFCGLNVDMLNCVASFLLGV